MTTELTLLYFARLREALGINRERIELPPDVACVQDLTHWLARRGGAWQEEFSGCRPLRAAINQELVPNSAAMQPGDEIAFFPPVTGG